MRLRLRLRLRLRGRKEGGRIEGGRGGDELPVLGEHVEGLGHGASGGGRGGRGGRGQGLGRPNRSRFHVYFKIKEKAVIVVGVKVKKK